MKVDAMAYREIAKEEQRKGRLLAAEKDCLIDRIGALEREVEALKGRN